MVSFSSTCNNTAANSEIVNESMMTFSEYSTNRFSTVRSIRIAVKYRMNSFCRVEGSSAEAGSRKLFFAVVMGSELLFPRLVYAQRVDLAELGPGIGQREEDRLADDLAEPDRQGEVAVVGEVVEEFAVVVVRLAEDHPRGKASAERRPRDADATEYEPHVRKLARLRDDRQQVPRHVDLARPELHEGEAAQLREVAAEVLDDLADDARVVVRILEIRRDRRAPAQEQAIVPGQPEVCIDELRVPALHLLARRKQDAELAVGQRLGHAQKR